MNIIDIIPFGKSNAISRIDLAEKLGVSDRKMRAEISRARENFAILNLQDGKGYYRPTESDREELQHYYSQEQARAFNILNSLKGAKIELLKLPKQTILKE